MPKIVDKKTPKKTKKQPPKDRPVKYPEVAVQVAAGDQALTIEKMKEMLGWEEETEDVKFGPDYHLTDRNGNKIRLRNSTHNRGFDQRLGEKYMYEHLNKRWQVNGEPRILGKYGEVISGQHSMTGAVLAEQERQKDGKWEENWPGPVTMSTIVVVGIEETDEVVNTVDTGKPRSLADTIYRSEYFADLPPKERTKTSRACDWAIRLVQLRIGVEDAFNPRKSHGASLAFLDNHLTLPKCVRHVCEEDKGGAVSDIVTPGYASALCYLMAASKTDPDQYVNRVREGDRREKYLDLSMLKKALEFWALAGKKETPELRALRDRLKNYASRKDSLGNLIEVSLEEKIAVLILAWQCFSEGKVPTLKDVTPRYEPAKDDDSPPLLKDPPRLGGIDMAGDEEKVDVTETEDEEDKPEHEKLKEELEATRTDRVKALVKQRAEEKKAQKEAMKNAEPATNGKAMSPADEIRQQFAPLYEANPGKVIFFKSRTSGGLTCIDGDATKVSKVLGSPATKDPGGFVRFTVNKADAKEKLAKLLDEGMAIAVAEEVVSGMKEKSVKVSDYKPE